MAQSITGSERKSSTMLFHLAALFVIAVWGTSFVSTKVLLDAGLHAVEIYIYRFFVAYLIVLAVCHKRLWSNSLVDELLFAVCGLCGGSIYFIAENTALNYTLTSNVSLITTLSPLLTTLLIGAIYKNERPGAWIYVGSVVAIVGVACIIFKSGFHLEVMPLGDLLALSAAFSWAIYSIVLRKVNANYSALFITRKTFFYGLLTALPFMAFEPEIAPLSALGEPIVLLNLLFLSLTASLIAYVIWSQTVKRLGAIKASNYLYFQPVVTMIVSAIMLPDDPLTLVGCLGCVLIIGGVWFGDFMTRKRG
ncbi:MAG: DMT family transporter [Bacteroidales bacterium]|nr:DMT family transporter [Bacteroidales bacterium]